jgi:Leucine-rich repeat (LRR) protein
LLGLVFLHPNDGQKLENAQKLGVLSLSEHGLEEVPAQLVAPALVTKLRTLDLSKNHLERAKHLPDRLGALTELKILNLDHNQLPAGSVHDAIAKLTKLQNLSLAGNQLGRRPTTTTTTSSDDPLASSLPSSLKQLNLSGNFLTRIPRCVLSCNLSKLEKLDLSSNQLTTVPDEIAFLSQSLQELRLDSNRIATLPNAMGQLIKLKSLSLRDNQISITTSEQQQQPCLPRSLFTDTALIDLNLHGNRLTNTQLNSLDGFQEFLDRRQKVKSKIMTNLDVCGLD